ncbi:MAG: ABC-type lipoprotein export system, ATPase component [Chloroflexi bacterium]|nr:MAG: ABC-type lipoprotein export system, ATPase component [Chloroflexota bacterium]
MVCEDVFKIYKVATLEVVALRGLDLHIERGEMLALVGASGSGKSTLLSVLAGLELPSAGSVQVDGRDLLTMEEADLVDYRRVQVGFVWQQTGRNLIPYLTAAQNIELPMVVTGMSRKAIRERTAALLEAVSLTHRAKSRPEQLSGGEQQRVSIAVALANNPPLLLADEPTGELDSHTGDQIFDLFTDLNHRFGVTVVIVTHDDHIADRVPRVVTIRDGRIATETYNRVETPVSGAPRTVRHEFAVVDRTGRLQIPKELREAARLGNHVSVRLDDGRVTISRDNDPSTRGPGPGSGA